MAMKLRERIDELRFFGYEKPWLGPGQNSRLSARTSPSVDFPFAIEGENLCDRRSAVVRFSKTEVGRAGRPNLIVR